MANTFVPITSLPSLPGAPALGMKMPIQAAGVTWKVDARQFVLPDDMLLTWSDQQSDLPGSRRVVNGPGISINVTSTELQISASSSGQIIVFDQTVDAALLAPIENWNPTGWDSGNAKNRLQVTPSATILLGGLDSSLAQDGQVVILLNESSAFNVRLAHDSAGSLAQNRFKTPGGATLAIIPNQAVQLMKKGADGWRLI
jgi:hypothetical protein